MRHTMTVSEAVAIGISIDTAALLNRAASRHLYEHPLSLHESNVSMLAREMQININIVQKELRESGMFAVVDDRKVMSKFQYFDYRARCTFPWVYSQYARYTVMLDALCAAHVRPFRYALES